MKVSGSVKKNGKTDIYGDGEFICTVLTEIWYSSSLFDGKDVQKAELESLKQLSDSFSAYESAVKMLSLRAHSEYELKMKLKRKFGGEAALAAIEKCRESGYLDDTDFAKRLACELYERKKYAPARILAELKERGISREQAYAAVKELDFNAECSIIYMAERYLAANADEKQRRTFINRLLRLGYSYAEIKSALGELFEGNDDSV